MARDIPKFPVPEVDNLRKASTERLAQEVITLREYVGHLFMWCKDVHNETGVSALVARMNTLEEQSLCYALTKDVHIAIEGLRKDLNGLNGAIDGARARLVVLEQWKRELEHTLTEEGNHDANSEG